MILKIYLVPQEVFILRPVCVSRRTLPLNLREKDYLIFESELERVFPALKLFHLRNINISLQGVIFKKFRPFAESFPEPHFKNDYNFFYLLSTYLRRKKMDLPEGKYVVVFNSWSHGYFHWVGEVLPRLFLVKEILADYELIFPESFRGQLIDSLAPFVFKGIKYIPDNSYFHVRNILFPALPAPSGSFNDQLMRDMREFYLSFYKRKKILDLGERIYVSRSKALRRKIINEEEVISLVKKYEFKIIYFEEHDFESQLGIAHHAKYLISIHGAGLVNVLFMNPGSFVLEIRTKEYSMPLCYFSLASLLNLNYLYQLDSTYKGEQTSNADILVNISQLEENICIMLNK